MNRIICLGHRVVNLTLEVRNIQWRGNYNLLQNCVIKAKFRWYHMAKCFVILVQCYISNCIENTNLTKSVIHVFLLQPVYTWKYALYINTYTIPRNCFTKHSNIQGSNSLKTFTNCLWDHNQHCRFTNISEVYMYTFSHFVGAELITVLHFISTLVVMSNENNAFPMSAFFVFSLVSGHWDTRTWARWRYTCTANTEPALVSCDVTEVLVTWRFTWHFFCVEFQQFYYVIIENHEKTSHNLYFTKTSVVMWHEGNVCPIPVSLCPANCADTDSLKLGQCTDMIAWCK